MTCIKLYKPNQDVIGFKKELFCIFICSISQKGVSLRTILYKLWQDDHNSETQMLQLRWDIR